MPGRFSPQVPLSVRQQATEGEADLALFAQYQFIQFTQYIIRQLVTAGSFACLLIFYDGPILTRSRSQLTDWQNRGKGKKDKTGQDEALQTSSVCRRGASARR